MAGNFTSRTITGVIMIILGLGLITPAFFRFYPTLIYGIPILLIGIYVLFNKKEDKIEQIKRRRK